MSSSNSHNRNSNFSLVSSITNCSNHSVSSSVGNIVSITVRKDNADNSTKKAGIKLEQDSNGQVTVKNIATNGLFGDTELEIGDTILSVNRRRLNTSEGEGPDLIMKWVHKYNTITISVRKKPVSLVSSSSDESTNSSNKKDKKSSTKKKKKKNKNKTTTKSSKEDVTNNNNNKIVTITAEVNTTTSTGYSLTNSNTKNKRKSNKSTTTTTPPTTTIGLVLEIRQDDQLFVKEIQHDSLFFVSSSSTAGSDDTDTDMLEVGDRILCINDMSFRQYADLDYAYQVMNKAKICITLHVEKQATKNKTTTKKGTSNNKIPKSSMSFLTSSLASSSCNDNGDDDDDDADTSIKSFTDDDSDEELDSSKKSTHSKKKKKKATSASSTTTSSTTTNSSKYKFDVQKSEFKIEKYCPVTITVPTAQTGYTKSSDSIGLEFRLVETNKGDALNTIVEDQKNNRNKHDRTKWVYVHKIEEDSIFQNTALKEGDKVISINDTDLRCSGAPTSKTTKRSGSRSASSSSSEDGGEGTTNIDTRKAYKACLQAKEFITLIVVKDDDSIFLEKSFCFDASSTDLDWKI